MGEKDDRYSPTKGKTNDSLRTREKMLRLIHQKTSLRYHLFT